MRWRATAAAVAGGASAARGESGSIDLSDPVMSAAAHATSGAHPREFSGGLSNWDALFELAQCRCPVMLNYSPSSVTGHKISLLVRRAASALTMSRPGRRRGRRSLLDIDSRTGKAAHNQLGPPGRVAQVTAAVLLARLRAWGPPQRYASSHMSTAASTSAAVLASARGGGALCRRRYSHIPPCCHPSPLLILPSAAACTQPWRTLGPHCWAPCCSCLRARCCVAPRPSSCVFESCTCRRWRRWVLACS